MILSSATEWSATSCTCWESSIAHAFASNACSLTTQTQPPAHGLSASSSTNAPQRAVFSRGSSGCKVCRTAPRGQLDAQWTRRLPATTCSRSVQVIVQATCPISILTGDYVQLGSLAATLLEYSAKNALFFWQVWGRCFKGVHVIKSGRVDEGLIELREGMEELRNIQYGVYYVVFLCEYAEALGLAGQPAQGLVVIDEAIARSEHNEENWYAAELLRVKGELILRRGAHNALADAMKHFQLSLDLARRQETPSWELRTAISLAKLHSEGKQPAMSQGLLRTMYAKFTEGHGSADLVLARRLLDDMPEDQCGA